MNVDILRISFFVLSVDFPYEFNKIYVLLIHSFSLTRP